MGLSLRGHCLIAAILLTPRHLTGSAFSDSSRVSLDSKQPLTALYTTKKMRLLLEESAALLLLKGAVPVCLAAKLHTACLKLASPQKKELASPINHLHHECLPLPSDIFVSLFIFNDDMAFSVSIWLFIFHAPEHYILCQKCKI